MNVVNDVLAAAILLDIVDLIPLSDSFTSEVLWHTGQVLVICNWKMIDLEFYLVNAS